MNTLFANADTWLSIANGELADHVKELDGSAAAARIIEYFSVTTIKAQLDEVPWCSAFVCWVMEKAGVPSTKSAMARSWLTWRNGAILQGLRYGTIVVLARGLPGSNQGHVGFLVSSRPGRIALLAGNESNKVSIEWHTTSHVLGYRWPQTLS